MPRTAICQACGREFAAPRKTSRFCSMECYARAERKPSPSDGTFPQDYADPQVRRLVDITVWRLLRRCPWLDRKELLSHAWEAIWLAGRKDDPEERYAYYAKAVWLRICSRVDVAPPPTVSADSAQRDCDWSPLVDMVTPRDTPETRVLLSEILAFLREERGERAVDEIVSHAQGETFGSIGRRYGVTGHAVMQSCKKSQELVRAFMGRDELATPDDDREP